MATLEHAREAKSLLRHEISGRRGVTGIGLARAGTGRSGEPGVPVPGRTAERAEDWVLRVNVASADVPVPSTVDGVEVEVRVTGAVTASS
ncbi:hypothetical protein [Cellulosimicrobium sp. NPDC057127]|uniref:hypothetical protein n=1 Tax=Cellulosimicrobium sp. NPDC057127 TaxID=3346026 RepID=UPI00362AB4F9